MGGVRMGGVRMGRGWGGRDKRLDYWLSGLLAALWF
jgi:hypothetical protein